MYIRNPDRYFLPNQTLEHIIYGESAVEERGHDTDNSSFCFVGGVFYSHYFKSRNPESEVVAVERDPLSAYTQEYAARNGVERSASQVLRDLLITDENIPEPDLEEIKDRHREFHEKSQVDVEFFDHVLEPNFDAFSMPHGYYDPGISSVSDLRKLLTDPADNPALYETVVEQVERGELDIDELESAALQDHSDLEECKKLLFGIRDRSHAFYAAKNDAYAVITDGGNGKNVVRTSEAGFSHRNVLRELTESSPPDQIQVADAREIESDADVIFTNNVPDHLSSREVADMAEGLTEGRALMFHGDVMRPPEIDSDSRVEVVENPLGDTMSSRLRSGE